jgi:hypothetical protein
MASEVFMLKFSMLAAAFLTTSQGAFAQQFPVGAGGQLQQIPPAPTPENPPPDIQVNRDEPSAAATPEGPKILVASIHVTGQTHFPEVVLISASGF